MTKYITGEKILDSWDINKFDLFDHVRQGLRAFKKITRHIFECPPEYNLKTKLENIDQWIAQMKNPNFPNNLENYHDEERLTGVEHPLLLDEMHQKRAKIIEKLDSIQRGKNTNDMCSWYYCDLPESEQKALAVINSVVDSLFLKTDVTEILGRPTKGAQDKIFDISKEKMVRYSTRVVRPKCRKAAKKIWVKDPDLAIIEVAGEILLSGIAKNKKSDDYTLERIQIWIREVCPNPRRGRKPDKNRKS